MVNNENERRERRKQKNEQGDYQRYGIAYELRSLSVLSCVFGGAECGTPIGKGKRICADSLYFDDFRPKWCPMTEVKDADNR